MENALPYEIIGAPFTLWWAPVGTPFPDIDDEPDPIWVKVGTSGDLNYTDEGVIIDHKQETTTFRALGDPGPRKAFRASEDQMIRLSLADLSPAQYRLALNNNGLTEVASGAVGAQKLGLSRGLQVATMALLVRGPSPLMGDGIMQYCVPICMQTGSPTATMRRDGATALQLEWTSLVDPNAASTDERFGYVLVQDPDVAGS